MKINLKQISVSLLFCFIFSILCSYNIFADTRISAGWAGDGSITKDDLKSTYTIDFTLTSNNGNKNPSYDLNAVKFAIQSYCAEKFKESVEGDFNNLNFVPEITVKHYLHPEDSGAQNIHYTKFHHYQDEDDVWHCGCEPDNSISVTTYMTNIDMSFLDYYTNYPISIEFSINETTYKIYTYTTNKVVNDGHCECHEGLSRASGDSNNKLQYQMAKNTKVVLEAFQEAAIRGIVAASIGVGYNVGTMYSQRQIALTDAMEKQPNGAYDFKNSTIFKQAFSYYMSPLFGKLDAAEYGYLFDDDSEEEWVALAISQQVFQGAGVKIDNGFLNFKSELTEDEINKMGLKITKSITFRDGAKRFQSFAANLSKDPASVLSYHMKIAYPYLFTKIGTSYSLDNQNLRIDAEYTYCVFNDRIYNSAFEEITDRGVIGISRNQIFLYYQDQAILDSSGGSSGESLPVGVVIIGEFDECVVDTSSNGSANVFYATGRKIGFNNGYSDLLTIDRANPNLMYNTSEGGRKGFLPRNAVFLPTEEEKEVAKNNYTLVGQAAVEGKGVLMKLPEISLSSIKTITTDITNHAYIDSPQFIKFFIVFDKVENRKAIEDYNTRTGMELDDAGKESLGLSHWAFLLIRNNMYINDSELLAWLRTDTARSITYVDADTLLAKITGDFVNGLKKLSFEDWSRMQDIKAELSHNKDMWLVRVFNIMSIVMGVFLFIFAVLICMVYWIDIFNTFSRVSLLQFVSMGRLYPVEDKDMIPYIGMNDSGVKYVTFKDVLILAAIFIVMGFFFLNVSTVITFIVKLYNYIMYVLGGL